MQVALAAKLESVVLVVLEPKVVPVEQMLQSIWLSLRMRVYLTIWPVQPMQPSLRTWVLSPWFVDLMIVVPLPQLQHVPMVRFLKLSVPLPIIENVLGKSLNVPALTGTWMTSAMTRT